MKHEFQTSAQRNELMVMELLEHIFFDDDLYNLTITAKHRINRWLESKLMELPVLAGLAREGKE